MKSILNHVIESPKDKINRQIAVDFGLSTVTFQQKQMKETERIVIGGESPQLLKLNMF